MGKKVSDWPSGNIVRETVGQRMNETDLKSRNVLGKRSYPKSVFSEGLAIDYKWFDKWSIQPRYEFGFGLRYMRRKD